MFLELCLLVALLYFVKCFMFKSRAKKMYDKFPGPRSYPIIGSMMTFEYPKVEVTETYKRLSFRYGTVYIVWLAKDPIVCLSNPLDIEIILRSTTELEKAPIFYWPIKPWLGQGLLTSTPDIWRKHRTILTSAFHIKILEEFIPVFVSNAHILIEKFSKIVGQDHDVLMDLELCTLDIICETAMGIKMDSQMGESEFVNAMRGFLEIAMHRSFHVLQRTFLFNLLPIGKRQNTLVKYLNEFTERVIKERKNKLSQTSDKKEHTNTKQNEIEKKKTILIDLLLQNNSEGVGLLDSEIREEVDTFIFAGADTTSSAIAFTLYNMSQNEDVQDTAYEEICSILGDRDPTNEDLRKMKYLEKVIKESLRLFPPAPLIARQTSKDIQLQSGHVIPANTAVVILIEAMNHDPVSYPNPNKFDPLRFDKKLENSYAYIPFSAGPRNCIGQKYAILQIKTVVALILRKFRLLPSNVPITPCYAATLKSKTGIHMKLEHQK